MAYPTRRSARKNGKKEEQQKPESELHGLIRMLHTREGRALATGGAIVQGKIALESLGRKELKEIVRTQLDRGHANDGVTVLLMAGNLERALEVCNRAGLYTRGWELAAGKGQAKRAEEFAGLAASDFESKEQYVEGAEFSLRIKNWKMLRGFVKKAMEQCGKQHRFARIMELGLQYGHLGTTASVLEQFGAYDYGYRFSLMHIGQERADRLIDRTMERHRRGKDMLGLADVTRYAATKAHQEAEDAARGGDAALAKERSAREIEIFKNGMLYELAGDLAAMRSRRGSGRSTRRR